MGYYLTDLADILRAGGLSVVEIEGWRSRGYTLNGGFVVEHPLGGLAHHTGTSGSASGNYPSLAVVKNGRAGIAGPLAQLGLGRDGTWYVIAAGRANHSGAVDDQRYFNSYAIGVEAEHPGGDTPWPPQQYESYVRGAAALQRAYGFGAWRGHKEAAVPHGRKPDPTFNMAQFRTDVADVLAGGPVVPVSNPIPAPAPVRDYLQRGDTGPAVVELQQLLGIEADGFFGPITEAKVRWYQADRGLLVDGIAGAQTMAALRSGAPSQPSGPVVIAPGVPAPDFPLPDGYYFGPKSGPVQSVSGYYSHRDDLRLWQQRMADRGWNIDPDGLYGPQTAAVALAFQREKGLGADSLIGPVTWGAAWTQPITR